MTADTIVLGPSTRLSPRGVVLLASGATFLAMLDATVTNLAVPAIHDDFPRSSLADLSWVITSYAVMFAAPLAPAGRLADIIGRRRLFMAGTAAFTLMSIATALAPNLPVLIAARAFQGIGAAAMIPASLAVILFGVPAERRAQAIGLWSASAALAAAIGPSVGGLLVDAVGWRSLFLINVPLGIAAVVVATRLPRADAAGGRLPDLVGTALVVVGIAALVIGVTKGVGWGWGDVRTVASIGGGLAAAGLALARSARHPAPAIDVSLWKSRTYAAANLATFLYGATVYAWLLVGVLFLTQSWGYSELKAGLAMSPGAVAAAIAAVGAGKVVARYGAHVVVAVGALLIVATGIWLVLVLSEQPSFLATWLPAGFLVGVGMGAVTTGTSAAAALSAPPVRFAGATGLNMTARQLGGALGIAVLAALVQSGSGRPLDRFVHVYVFCTITAGAAALVGLRLASPAKPATVVDTTAEAAREAAVTGTAGLAPQVIT